MRSTTPGLLLMTSLVVSAMPTVVPRGIENLNRIEKLTKYSVKFASSSTTKVPRDWHHLSPSSGVEGISSKLAHETSQEEPIRNIIVAVIDSGVDVNHEDLQGQVWINDDEVPNNGVDDDKNGYVDDVFGWNFIGGEKGQAKFVADSTLKNKLYLERGLPQFQIEQDTREATRELVRLRNLEEELSREGKDLSKSQQQYLEKLDLEVRKEYSNSLKLHSRYLSYLNSFKKHKKILRAAGLEHFSLQSVQEFTPSNEKERNAKNRLIAFLEDGADEKSIKSVLDYYNKNILYYYNIEWDSRAIVGDDYLDLSERYYGNNDVIGPFADHGTHVAGIIAASRDNGIGIQGITSSVKTMAIRAIPDGDERDKDVANAIYYAIDNGANIINMSFAKKYSPAKSYVDQAVAYGQRRGVLFIHAAGNTGQDTDQAPVFPMPISDSIRFSNWIEVGASTPRRGPNLVADFSNYGGQSVDFFAPGLNLYSTVAGNKYDTLSGTSMASPCVAGISAYLMARDFQITPTQIRSLLIKSSRRYPGLDVILPGASESGEARPVMVPFAHLSTYGSIVDLLNTID